MPRCHHDSGWFSVEPQGVFVELTSSEPRIFIGVGGGRKPVGRVLLKCNLPACKARRYAYFDQKSGRFLRFGQVR